MRYLKWLFILCVQAAALLALYYGLTMSMWLSAALYSVLSWTLMPLAGAFSAYLATKRGLNNYLAWLAPPAMLVLAHWLAFFYLPDSAAPTLFTAFISIIGAATGEVIKRRNAK